MKTKVKITGLECPNCARTLQNEINKIDGVKNAAIDFVKNNLTFESDTPEKSLDEIKALTKELEPQAVISAGETKLHKNLFLDIGTLLAGTAIGVLIMFCPMPKWAFWTLYAISALLLGYKTYYKALKLLCKGVINENLLITISVIGASFVTEQMHNQHLEGLMVIALYSIGKIFEGLAVERSRRSIEKLARMQPEYANVKRGRKEERVAPGEVELGETIIVRAGEKVPIDGKIIKGQALINYQSLTGESAPVTLSKNDEILSGGIVLDAEIQIKTTSLYKNSAISKIIDLVENASENKSKTETFISKITRWYTLGVVLCALLVWGIFWAATGDILPAIYKGLMFLVISCPCAFAISVPLSYFAGLGNASKNGVLVKGSNFLDACANLNVIAFDKTGTLTTGEFQIKKITAENGYKRSEVLFYAALGEQHSLHPLAKAITAACKNKLAPVQNVHEVAGQGVEYSYHRAIYFVGRKSKDLKATVVEVYKNDARIGIIELSDTVKQTAFAACCGLKKMGIKTILLSGDNTESAQNVASKLEMDEAHAGLLPEQKFAFLQDCKAKGLRVGYVGDGINDAPSLALADVGFSMGINGAPASIEASDVVIVDDNPQKILTAIKVARHTRKIVWENIILSALIKVTFLALGTAGITGMFVAVLADVGVTLVAILNSLRALYYKHNESSKK